MRTIFLSVLVLCVLVCTISCTNNSAETAKPLTKEEQLQKNLDTLKAVIQDGDLITRMNDNVMSYQIRVLNANDRTFSHAGIIMTKDGKKIVCNIDAGPKGMDTVRYEAIDSFLNLKDNSICGLFRYKLSNEERQAFLNELNAYHDKRAKFDHAFDPDTDSLVYCTEMIAKSLDRATAGRISIKGHRPPEHTIPMFAKFFKDIWPANKMKKILATRVYISIDDLYLRPECVELMRFPLKFFPGQE
jgi:hypothetical protein